MEELVRQVAERTGISEAQAQTAVTTVLASIQAATDEPSLVAAAEESLKEVLGVTGGKPVF